VLPGNISRKESPERAGRLKQYVRQIPGWKRGTAAAASGRPGRLSRRFGDARRPPAVLRNLHRAVLPGNISRKEPRERAVRLSQCVRLSLIGPVRFIGPVRDLTGRCGRAAPGRNADLGNRARLGMRAHRLEA
jgi:hypothetical protein